jgi:hypothetical protein
MMFPVSSILDKALAPSNEEPLSFGRGVLLSLLSSLSRPHIYLTAERCAHWNGYHVSSGGGTQAILDFELSSRLSFLSDGCSFCLLNLSHCTHVQLAIPDFASIMGLIGSTCCMLLALIMPGLLHLHYFKGYALPTLEVGSASSWLHACRQLTRWQLYFDYLLVGMGSFFTLTGTLEALGRIAEVHSAAGDT